MSAFWEWALLVALVWCAAAATPSVIDATGQPIDQDAEDARERANGHRDHELPGGVLD